MIRALRVRNLATIEELALELGPGLHVVTGETGAGKSVLLGAITALGGRRISAEAVRTGAESATVEAILEGEAILARARELGLAEDGDSELLVQRTIAADGRGKVFVNGRLATVSVLRELTGDFLEVVSQGEHQRLLRPETQGELLDRYGRLEPLADEVAQAHRGWRAIAGELHERRARAGELARREDQLRFECEQIDQADLRRGELEELETERARLAHVDRLGQAVAAALGALDADGGARDSLGTARVALEPASGLDATLADPLTALERAAVELAEAVRSLERYASGLEADPARLDAVERRLEEIRRLQTRYGPTVDEILAHRDRARAELERIGGGETRTAELEGDLVRAAGALEESARRLGSARREVAAHLAERVQAELAGLDLGRARFEIAFGPIPAKTDEGWEPPCGPSGFERPELLLAANPGEPPRRLRDAASGGELARLLLAIRNALRDADAGRVLLFDEVDAGVGGRTASRVGERLRALARHHQVLCVTHLPQVAALGHGQFRVAKEVRGGRTRTRVLPLDAEARVEEIARMAGGGRVTETARAHARELLNPRSDTSSGGM